MVNDFLYTSVFIFSKIRHIAAFYQESCSVIAFLGHAETLFVFHLVQDLGTGFVRGSGERPGTVGGPGAKSLRTCSLPV